MDLDITRKTANKRGVIGVAVLALVLALLVALPAALAHADSSYKVQPGDTLSGIAARYGTTIDAIVAANHLSSRTIYAGQTLTIPSAGSTASQPAQSNGTYTVQAGDTLSGIAARFGTTTDALMRANGLTSTGIYAGQVLKIVAPDAAPPQPTAVSQPAPTQTQQPQGSQGSQQPKPATYTVQSGDTLTGVASRFGLTRETLAAANGISPSSYLYVGQVLKIPSGNQPAQPSVPTTTPQPAGSPASVEPGKPVTYVVQAGDNLASIAAKFNTTVAALIRLNNLPDANFVYSGQVLTVVKGNDQADDLPSNTPVPEPTPPMGQFGPKWVDVSLSTQTMVAYEGTVPVFTAKISSGVPAHPTVIGIYRVYAKYTSTRMHGGTPGVDYYDIPNVPWTMYFYADYALHGAYWHNNFGQPMSHGCVNLSVDVSKWLYNWAPVGTLVVTHK